MDSSILATDFASLPVICLLAIHFLLRFCFLLLSVSMQQPPQKKEEKKKNDKDPDPVVLQQFFGEIFRILWFFFIRDSMTSYQKTLRIHSVRIARIERDQIFSGLNVHRFHFIRIDNQPLIYLIRKRSVQHTDEKLISVFQLVNVRKQLGANQSGMSRENGVCSDLP